MTAALLFLTPMSFLVSIARNSSFLVDRLALLLGLILGPILAYRNIELDVMWAGVGGGTIAYLAHRMRDEVAMSLTTSALWPYVVLVLVGFLPNEVWRWLGFIARARDREDRKFWFGCGRWQRRCLPP